MYSLSFALIYILVCFIYDLETKDNMTFTYIPPLQMVQSPMKQDKETQGVLRTISLTLHMMG